MVEGVVSVEWGGERACVVDKVGLLRDGLILSRLVGEGRSNGVMANMCVFVFVEVVILRNNQSARG